MTTDSDVIIGLTDRQLAVDRLIGFPLNIEACLRCVLAGVSPGRLWTSGALVNRSLERRSQTPE